VSLRLEIRVPEEVVLQADVVSLQAGDATGRFGLRPGHEPFVTVLSPGLIICRAIDGREWYVAADGGVLLLEDDLVSVVTREAVVADRLDAVADAAAAMVTARQEEEHQAGVTAEQLTAMLLRELREAQSRP
jgi:F-type H+-transporting ATPase subunit epsilon